jgi:hypothetical protein
MISADRLYSLRKRVIHPLCSLLSPNSVSESPMNNINGRLLFTASKRGASYAITSLMRVAPKPMTAPTASTRSCAPAQCTRLLASDAFIVGHTWRHLITDAFVVGWECCMGGAEPTVANTLDCMVSEGMSLKAPAAARRDVLFLSTNTPRHRFHIGAPNHTNRIHKLNISYMQPIVSLARTFAFWRQHCPQMPANGESQSHQNVNLDD